MRFRHSKQIVSLALAGVLAAGGMGVPLMRANAGEIMVFEQVMRGASMENGLSYSAEELETDFNGTNVFEASAADVGLFKDNIKGASSIDISMTFKVTKAETSFIKLLELYDSKNNANKASQPQSTIGIIVSTGGVVYLETGSHDTGTDWQAVTNKKINDGNFHTLQISISGNGMTVQMDGGTQVSVNSTGDRNTKSFVQAFFGEAGTSYKDWRQEMDCVVIGGMSSNSYFNHPNYSNLNGEITSVTIAGKNSTETPVGNGVASVMFEENSLDNTWLFGGGVETQGRFAEVGGIRNFIGQFEEYVRWEKRVDGILKGMQRYTINAGKAGQDAAAFADRLPELVEKADPMAVSYLIGPEDYTGNEDTEVFKAALKTIVDTALALKDGKGCAVIQYPHAVKDAGTNTKIETYIAAAKQVVQGYTADEKNRIAVVDHYTKTNTDEFKNAKLTEEGLLNAEGHYEIAKQFSEAVYGSSTGFPTITDSWTEEAAPEEYLNILPKVTASASSLEVTVDGETETEWKYAVTVDGTKIRGTASGNPFTIDKLPEGKDYELTVQTGDGMTQLSTVAGTITEGNVAQAPALTEMQQAIRDKVEQTEGPLTWIFMGDSITHAAAHTHGYDGIAQIFEKYLKEDLGRTDDIVVNTAVSGATAERTIENVEQRVTKYKPDIVSIMLGTNDKKDNNVRAKYKENLKSIVEAIRTANPDALIIFRSPTPGTNGWQENLDGDTGVVPMMQAVAEEDGNILYIDQYTEWNKETTAYPYLFTSKYYYGDNTVHLGAPGHIRMTQQFIEECGLNTNTKIAELSYQFAYTEEKSDVRPEVQIAEGKDGITVSKSALQTAYGSGNIGEMTVTLTDKNGRSYTKSAGLDDTEVSVSLPTSRTYTVKVTANMKGNTAKRVTFEEANILLSTGAEKEELKLELLKQRTYMGMLDAYTKESAEAFRKAYDEAEQAVDIEKDVEKLTELREALAKSAEALVKKAVIGGVQTVTISGDKVTVPAQADYTASDLVWSADKSSAHFTLTVNEKALFGSTVRVNVANAAELHVVDVKTEGTKNVLTVTLTVKEAVKEGGIYNVGKYSYKVTSLSGQTVEIAGLVNESPAKITVPNQVKLDGKDYKVTAVGASAFKNNKKVTSVVIGSNVKTIGKNAFAGCAKLKKVTVKGNRLTQIGSKAFMNCKKLTTITIKSKVLKKAGAGALKGISKKAIIKVPKAKRKAYTKLFAKKGQSKTVKIK